MLSGSNFSDLENRMRLDHLVRAYWRGAVTEVRCHEYWVLNGDFFH